MSKNFTERINVIFKNFNKRYKVPYYATGKGKYYLTVSASSVDEAIKKAEKSKTISHAGVAGNRGFIIENGIIDYDQWVKLGKPEHPR